MENVSSNPKSDIGNHDYLSEEQYQDKVTKVEKITEIIASMTKGGVNNAVLFLSLATTKERSGDEESEGQLAVISMGGFEASVNLLGNTMHNSEQIKTVIEQALRVVKLSNPDNNAASIIQGLKDLLTGLKHESNKTSQRD